MTLTYEQSRADELLRMGADLNSMAQAQTQDELHCAEVAASRRISDAYDSDLISHPEFLTWLDDLDRTRHVWQRSH